MPRWYHPNSSTVDAERKLLEEGEDGSFLVRPSKSCPGQYSLSVRKDNEVTHIKIRYLERSETPYDLCGGERFGSLASLIQYYTEKGIRANGEVIKLKRPLYSPDSPTELWYHGPISGEEAEKKMLNEGVNGSFLVRDSQSKVGDYVLTVRTKDRVTQVMIRCQTDGKYDVGGGEKFRSLTKLVEHYLENPMVETTGTVVNLKIPLNATRFTAFDIDDRIRELSKDIKGKMDGFWEEFEHLQNQESRMLLGRKVGQEDRHKSKNRYRYILPYDYTRVVLIRDNESDYINANYVKLVDCDASSTQVIAQQISPKIKPVPHSKVYIATQGPLLDTVNDFWWMVWQEKSECIVMVTEDVERGKNKCCRYWPSMENQQMSTTMRCGPLEIRIISDTKTEDDGQSVDYSYREFELSCLDGDENNDRSVVRRVVQYQYHSWPDAGLPVSSSSILNFLNIINSRPPKGPMIVHCSAGIGRSGTLIVIDMIMDQLKYRGHSYELDIQRIVKITRAQRAGLVQVEAQYKVIYLVIQNYIASYKHNNK